MCRVGLVWTRISAFGTSLVIGPPALAATLTIPHQFDDYLQLNLWRVPETYAPGHYMLTRRTGDTGTKKVEYDVFFVIPGDPQC